MRRTWTTRNHKRIGNVSHVCYSECDTELYTGLDVAIFVFDERNIVFFLYNIKLVFLRICHLDTNIRLFGNILSDICHLFESS